MSQDLTYIRNKLKTCEEVDSPFDIKIGQIVRYITLKNGGEHFFDGGEYVKMTDNKIVLKVNSKYEYVQLIHHNKDGFTVHRSRLFVEKNIDMNGGGSSSCSKKDAIEYEKIIKTQQDIIEKMNIQMKKQHQLILKLQNQN